MPTLGSYRNMEGQRFGRYVVISFSHRQNRQLMWKCRCDCGTIRAVNGYSLRNGLSLSCGCLKDDITSIRSTTHGYSGTPTYRTWAGMIERCTNANNARFGDYGGRGIAVCERWYGFENFLSDMGDRPSGFSIDRIDNEKGYSPDNCKWSTCKEQANNRRQRSCKKKGVEFKGVSFKQDRKKWRTYAKLNGQIVHIGYFSTEKEAIDFRNTFLCRITSIDEGLEAVRGNK